MGTMTAERAYSEVRTEAEKIRSDAPARVEMEVGDVVRQGDIYITRLRGLPAGRTTALAERQLAPGQTQGSRHIVEGPARLLRCEPVEVERALRDACGLSVTAPEPLIGPVIDATGEVTVTHPEHGNRTLCPGVYAVTYQRAFADEVRAVQD